MLIPDDDNACCIMMKYCIMRFIQIEDNKIFWLSSYQYNIFLWIVKILTHHKYDDGGPVQSSTHGASLTISNTRLLIGQLAQTQSSDWSSGSPGDPWCPYWHIRPHRPRPGHATHAHTNTDPGARGAGLWLVGCDLTKASDWSIRHPRLKRTHKWPHTAQVYGQGVSGVLRFRIFILDRHVRWGRSSACPDCYCQVGIRPS